MDENNLNLLLKNEDSDDQGEKKRNQCQGESLSEKDPQKNEHRGSCLRPTIILNIQQCLHQGSRCNHAFSPVKIKRQHLAKKQRRFLTRGALAMFGDLSLADQGSLTSSYPCAIQQLSYTRTSSIPRARWSAQFALKSNKVRLGPYLTQLAMSAVLCPVSMYRSASPL